MIRTLTGLATINARLADPDNKPKAPPPSQALLAQLESGEFDQ